MNERTRKAEARRQAIAEARKVERERTAAVRATTKAITTVMREIFRDMAARESRTPPQPDFQSWGAVKTRAWTRAANECQRMARTKTPRAERLRLAVYTLRDITLWSAYMCAEFLQPKPRKPKKGAAL